MDDSKPRAERPDQRRKASWAVAWLAIACTLAAVTVNAGLEPQAGVSGVFVEGIELSVTHRHRWSKGQARIRLYADEFVFEEEGNAKHSFSIHPREIRRMNSARAESIWQQFVYTIHFRERTNAGNRISFLIGEFGVGTLRDYVSKFAPEAEIRD